MPAPAPISAVEQLLIELINRARLDPLGEAARLGMDLNAGLAAGTLNGAARQPLAPNALLAAAAQGHAQWMLTTDVFSHTGQGGSSPGVRMQAAGYAFEGSWTNGENIAWAGTTGGVDLEAMMRLHHDGLFESAGHRLNMLNGSYRELGVAQLDGSFTSGGRAWNASMLVENFALSGRAVFLTGVVYQDSDGDGFYSVGEGRSGTSLSAQGATTVSLAAGGYALELSAAAAVPVTLVQGGQTTRLLVDLSGGNAKVDLVSGGMVMSSADLTLVSGATRATALGVGDIDLTGNAAANVLNGNDGANILRGEAGDDVIRGYGGNDVIYGGDGADRILAGGGDDVVYGDFGRDRVRLQSGNDIFYDSGEGGADGRDVVYGGTGRDIIYGSNGNDRYFGDESNDILYGRNGNDRLSGGPGYDQLHGGDGADTFVFARGFDSDGVWDFEPGVDRLELDARLVPGGDIAALLARATVDHGRLVLDFGGGDVLTLAGVSSAAGLAGFIDLV
jgi:Ca2+-binding RTX toxin-like protein